jgi:hypothetical protein
MSISTRAKSINPKKPIELTRTLKKRKRKQVNSYGFPQSISEEDLSLLTLEYYSQWMEKVVDFAPFPRVLVTIILHYGRCPQHIDDLSFFISLLEQQKLRNPMKSWLCMLLGDSILLPKAALPDKWELEFRKLVTPQQTSFFTACTATNRFSFTRSPEDKEPVQYIAECLKRLNLILTLKDSKWNKKCNHHEQCHYHKQNKEKKLLSDFVPDVAQDFLMSIVSLMDRISFFIETFTKISILKVKFLVTILASLESGVTLQMRNNFFNVVSSSNGHREGKYWRAQPVMRKILLRPAYIRITAHLYLWFSGQSCITVDLTRAGFLSQFAKQQERFFQRLLSTRILNLE